MKFGKITSAKVAENALILGGAFGGGAISGGLVTLVPEEQKLYARGGMMLLGVLGASALKPKTSGETLVQAIAIGMAIRQTSELVKHFAAKEIQVTPESTASQKFVAGAAGLACPCDSAPRMLASPVIDFPMLTGVRNPQIESVYQEVADEATEVSSNMF